MLTFTKASGATLGTYFDEHLLPSATKANYYLDSNSPGRWDGKLMSKFDLSHEPVEKHDFISIAKNEDPITGNRITPRNSEARRAAWDVCLSAVKSASIALLKDPEIKKIHEECSRLTMLELEKSILAQNNDQYGRGYDETGHGLWASFTHLESRASLVPFKGREAYIPDVQLHTHNILMGITYSNSRNSFFALENFNSKSLASYYEAYYHSLMAYKLREKGYVIRRTAKRYEIEGISRQVIEKFSNRTAHIEKVAKDKNITDQKAKSELGAKTRVSKSKAEDLTAKELHEHWISRLTPEELNDLETLKEQTDTQQETLSVKEVVDRAIEHWEERYSAFPIQRVMATALSLSYGQYIPSDIEKEIRSRPNILTKDIDTIESMATKEMVRVENRLNELALSAKSQVVPDKPKDFNHFNLNQQQEKVYREVLQSPNALHLIKGGAGTGKSRLLSAVNETVNELNKSLFAITPTSQQAEMLRQDGLQADTIAALLTNPTLAENFKDGYLIVDEAGQVGVKDMTKILELAKAQKAKAILSGDSNQHHSVAYGDAFRMLQERAKIPVSTLQNIVRQKPDNYRKAIAELSAGRTLEGYQKLDKMHAIKEIEDHDERMENIASDYIKSREQNRSALVVSPTNHEGSLINSVIRQKLREKGKLKGQDKTFNTLRSLSLTEAQRKDPFVYEES
ncbi:MAG: MobF family relaxase, partial [Bacteroidota bacterium]